MEAREYLSQLEKGPRAPNMAFIVKTDLIKSSQFIAYEKSPYKRWTETPSSTGIKSEYMLSHSVQIK